ncbi:MAG: LD-carboxypeptidase [Fimbriimonadales bacterium]|nr:LD-carboxypeptidase [Fimbriimonadales bacterium]
MNLLKPKAIEPGARLGVVSPSSPINADELEKGLAPFYQRGYQIVLGEHALARRGYLAGTDEQRARDLMAMFAREDIDAVLCARGGYGAARLIPYIDPAVFRNHPKLLIGYSDITVLHLWLQRHVGLVSLYAPMPITMTRRIPEHAMAVFWRALEVPEPLGELPPWDASYRTIVAGKAQGRITGGCLCLVADSIGTPYEIETRNAIVVLEDVEEPPYRLDAMLNHLKLAGKWEGCRGIAFSEDTRWEQRVKAEEPTLTPDEVLDDYFGSLPQPSMAGFPFGHIHDPLTLPYGVLAELDSERGKLTILESATVPR